MKVKEWPLSERGLLYDREWMVCDSRRNGLSLKKHSALCTISPTIDITAETLYLSLLPSNSLFYCFRILRAPNMNPISINLKVMPGGSIEEIKGVNIFIVFFVLFMFSLWLKCCLLFIRRRYIGLVYQNCRHTVQIGSKERRSSSYKGIYIILNSRIFCN